MSARMAALLLSARGALRCLIQPFEPPRKPAVLVSTKLLHRSSVGLESDSNSSSFSWAVLITTADPLLRSQYRNGVQHQHRTGISHQICRRKRRHPIGQCFSLITILRSHHRSIRPGPPYRSAPKWRGGCMAAGSGQLVHGLQHDGCVLLLLYY